MMRAALILAGLMVTSATVRSAEPESEPLDADFLEYLANLEADDDNWTLLAEPAEQPASPPDSKSRSETAAPRKPSKEAAKPAAEER